MTSKTKNYFVGYTLDGVVATLIQPLDTDEYESLIKNVNDTINLNFEMDEVEEDDKEEYMHEMLSQWCSMLPLMFSGQISKGEDTQDIILSAIMMLKHCRKDSHFFHHEFTGQLMGAAFMFEEMIHPQEYYEKEFNKLAKEIKECAILLQLNPNNNRNINNN